ncbi:MOSC domain-containing protein [Acetobacter sp.]|uniref:MOSC domain-containing protein n=1 Tax=Acetobacter sp. TaxID=440 RepID=UPI0039EC042F
MLTVHSLHIYPVKSLHGVSLSSLWFDPWGGENDRRWLVIDLEGQFITQRTHPVMATIRPENTPDGLILHTPGCENLSVPFPHDHHRSVTVWKDTMTARDAGEAAALWLSEIIGEPCRLVHMDRPDIARLRIWKEWTFHNSFSDGFPVLVTSTASLTNLNRRLNNLIPMERFRPNLVIDGAEAWDEDRWVKLQIGELALTLVKPCSRCVMTSVDQETGEHPDRAEPLRTLATFRRQTDGIMFGQNALVERIGQISVGDTVDVIETRQTP